MEAWNITATTPAEYLAWDEAFLDECEATGRGALWFWESQETFVVVGYSQQIEREVNLSACRESGVPVLRRCSGGGAVVQGPGCLSYGLTLPFDSAPGHLSQVTSTNRFIMESHCRALRGLLGPAVHVQGHTDLVFEGRKFSGNAQRRRQKSLLFHGTFLWQFDLPWVAKLLQYPSRSPGYRAGRAHGEFLFNCNLNPDVLKAALREAWGASHWGTEAPRMRMLEALEARYSRPAWHERRG